MKEDQEFKHACKFCSKSFPCGRSLGGHMRSHLTNNNSPETEDAVAKRKLSFVSNGGNDNNNNNTSSVTCSEAGAQSVYVLRENPKKTWRLAVSSEDTSLHDKLCKECGKGFLSWKALFGHMKCHSEKERVSNPSLEEQDSWASANQKPVMDSQSDNETAQPNRRRRSKRRTRFIGTANSCSFSLPNNGSSSVSETEQEQEELAMCLMMLSRDVTNRGGLNSIAESSDNNSVLLGAKFEVKSNGDDTQKSKKLKEKLESSTVDSASRISRTESKLDKNQVSSDGLFMNDNRSKPPLENQLGFDKFGAELWKNLTKDNGFDQAPSCSSKFNSSKKSLRDPNSVSGSEFCKDSQKRSKFECTTCNKIFNSYQALGGHRASHKKIKGCFASRVESSENSIETELSPDLTADSKLIKSSNNEVHTDQLDDKPQMKKTKAHECPICLKIFPSGQALGGHKRSHLVAGSTTSESKTSQAMVTEKPILEIRDLLDLNLPAPVEEDTNTRVGFKPWWVGSSHKQEGIVGLIRN